MTASNVTFAVSALLLAVFLRFGPLALNDVISTGDIFSTLTYPVIDRKHGGTFKGILASIEAVYAEFSQNKK